MPCSPSSGVVPSTSWWGCQRLSEIHDNRRTGALYGGKTYRQKRYALWVPTSIVSPALMSRKFMPAPSPELWLVTWVQGRAVPAFHREQGHDAFLGCLSLPISPPVYLPYQFRMASRCSK